MFGSLDIQVRKLRADPFFTPHLAPLGHLDGTKRNAPLQKYEVANAKTLYNIYKTQATKVPVLHYARMFSFPVNFKNYELTEQTFRRADFCSPKCECGAMVCIWNTRFVAFFLVNIILCTHAKVLGHINPLHT